MARIHVDELLASVGANARPATTDDYEQVAALYAAGKCCWSLEADELHGGTVIVNAKGQVISFAGFKPVAECYFLVDSNWGTPEQRVEQAVKLHAALEKKLMNEICTPVDRESGTSPASYFRSFIKWLKCGTWFLAQRKAG